MRCTISPGQTLGRSFQGNETHDCLLEENLGGANIEISSEDLHQIAEALSKVEIHGARYPERLQAMVNR
jgi:hypothetical protein